MDHLSCSRALYLGEEEKSPKLTSGILENPTEKPAFQLNVLNSEILKIDKKSLEIKKIPLPPENYNWGFQLLNGQSVFLFFLESENEFQNWIDFLNVVCSGESAYLTSDLVKTEESLRISGFYIRPEHLDFEHGQIIGTGASGNVSRVEWHQSVVTVCLIFSFIHFSLFRFFLN